jgi:luciferase family oxidoreductase group 1
MVGAVAAATSTIRVGSGGVMLSHYSPFKVAETFRTLAALHPGRIDLGVGRAPGSDPVAEAALQYVPGPAGEERFPAKVADLVGFVEGRLAPGHPYETVTAMPVVDAPPRVWVLGSSSSGAAVAAYLGLPFAFAHFITPAFGPQVVTGYRKGFQPSAAAAEPSALVAVSVICAETDEEADRLATSMDVWRLRPEGKDRGPLLAPEEAAAVPLSPLDRDRVAQGRSGMVIGGPERVRRALLGLAEAFPIDELLAVTVCHDPKARVRSYELVAGALGLVPGG